VVADLLVRRENQRAVDVAASRSGPCAARLLAVHKDHQHLDAGADSSRNAPWITVAKYGVVQDLGLRLGQDQGDRAGTLGDQRPGGVVGRVAERGRSGQHDLA